MAAIITLTTDFGTRDGFVGAMKGEILSICSDVVIIDITHELQPQDIVHCSWALLRSSSRFPAGSIHVVVVDPGVGSDRRAVLMKSEGHWYVGPDNGVFSEIIRQYGTEEVFEISKKTDLLQSHSSFDGLALFAPVAAHLARGLPANKTGVPPTRMLTILPSSTPIIRNNRVEGQIILFDHFGNAMTNISRENLEKQNRPSLIIRSNQIPFHLVNHYEEGGDNQAIALINSDGYLELSIFGNSAHQKFNLKTGDVVTMS